MKWLLVVVALLALMVASMFLTGVLIPVRHSATRAAEFRESPQVLWQAITDYKQFPQWRSDVVRVEPLPSPNSLPAHREWDRHGHSLPIETIEFSPPVRLVGRIADPSLPFAGTWTFEISPHADGTVVRIRENGEIRNPIFRFLTRFVFGYTATIETYLRDLGRKFGDPVQTAP